MQVIDTKTGAYTRFPLLVSRLTALAVLRAALGLLGHILRGLHEHVSGKNGQILANPLPADDAALIHEEEGPPCQQALIAGVLDLGACRPVQDSIRPCHLQTQVAEQGIGQFE